MVHPALVGGLVAGVAIAAILGYLYVEEHFTQSHYANMGSVPVASASEDIDLDESSSEDGDDDALDWFAKKSGLRKRRKTQRKVFKQIPDGNAIQEKYSDVIAMEQAMERRRRALEVERLEIERQEQEIAHRRSLLPSTSNSAAGSYVSPPSASASISPVSVSAASASPPASVTVSLAASEDPFNDVWSVTAASTTASVHEPALTNFEEEVVVFNEEATIGNQLTEPKGPRSTGPRSTDSWEDLDQTMSNASTE